MDQQVKKRTRDCCSSRLQVLKQNQRLQKEIEALRAERVELARKAAAWDYIDSKAFVKDIDYWENDAFLTIGQVYIPFRPDQTNLQHVEAAIRDAESFGGTLTDWRDFEETASPGLIAAVNDKDAARYRALRFYMSLNQEETWREVCELAAVGCWASIDAFNQFLESPTAMKACREQALIQKNIQPQETQNNESNV